MGHNELISIVLTLYNKAPYIEKTLFSIYKQTYTNWELIIVDDCSTDGSFEIAKSFCEKLGITEKCKFFHNETNLWVAETFERWLKEAKGDWIAMCDGDDIWVKNKLAKQLELCEEKKVDFCFCEFILINENNQIIWNGNYPNLMKRWFKNPTYKIYLLTSNVVGSWVFFKKNIANGLLQLWFPSTVYQDCWAIIWNHLLNGKSYWIHEKLFFYRKSQTSIYNSLSQLSFYQKQVLMIMDIQKYILNFSKDHNIIHRIKKKNIVDILFAKRLNNKETFIHVLRGIFISWLEFKYKWILLYQAFNIQFLKRKKWFKCKKNIYISLLSFLLSIEVKV